MESTTADEVLERIRSSAAGRAVALSPCPVSLDGGADDDNSQDEVLFPSDPLRRRKDLCLDRLAGIARLEARAAAEKVGVLTELVEVSTALATPVRSPQEATAQEMALIAEVACVLTVSERTASGACQVICVSEVESHWFR